MRIHVLYFEGCPHVEMTMELVRALARLEGVEHSIEVIEIHSQDDAIRHRFLGSPTVRVNGMDVEVDARSRNDFTLACRLYGTSGLPSAETIVGAIREAARA